MPAKKHLKVTHCATHKSNARDTPVRKPLDIAQAITGTAWNGPRFFGAFRAACRGSRPPASQLPLIRTGATAIAKVSFREPVSFVIEPVCGMPKRKLENGEQRPAPQNLGFGPEILKIRR
jgi:hypothetical protein